MNFINSFNLNKNAKIIDFGAGESDSVIIYSMLGFLNITVLDISAKALEKAQDRLGDKANKVKWIINDTTEFKTETTYKFWHNRAVFHFLTIPEQIEKHNQAVKNFISGNLIIGRFSETGRLKCSGLEISQYNEERLASIFSENLKN